MEFTSGKTRKLLQNSSGYSVGLCLNGRRDWKREEVLIGSLNAEYRQPNIQPCMEGCLSGTANVNNQRRAEF
jgi:hypothetical protein